MRFGIYDILDTVPVNKCFLEYVPVNKVKRDLKPCVYCQKHIYQATTVTVDSEITEIQKINLKLEYADVQADLKYIFVLLVHTWLMVSFHV